MADDNERRFQRFIAMQVTVVGRPPADKQTAMVAGGYYESPSAEALASDTPEVDEYLILEAETDKKGNVLVSKDGWPKNFKLVDRKRVHPAKDTAKPTMRSVNTL